jgi:hypothetical protein
MVVRWVFLRGDERASIDIVRTDMYYVVHVREPNGERWLTVSTVLDAILEQADVERALAWGGWYLADFLRSGRPGQTHSPSGAAWAVGDALPLPAVSPSAMSSGVDAPAACTG